MTRAGFNASEIMLSPLPSLSLEEVHDLAAETFHITGTLTRVSGERDLNFKLVAHDGRTYILKLASLTAPARQELVLQNDLLKHIERADPDLPVPRVISSVGPGPIAETRMGSPVLMRLLSYLDGTTMFDSSPTPALRVQVGAMAARLDSALSTFDHPLNDRPLIWDLARFADLADLVVHLNPEIQMAALAGRVFDRFEQHVRPILPSLRQQFIHNDLNQHNLLVDSEKGVIAGIIDFGDILRGSLAAELAIATAHQLYRQDDVLAAVGEVVAGYVSVLPLSADELAILPTLIQCRLLMRELIVAWRRTLNPAASGSYRDDVSQLGWAALMKLDAISHGDALAAVTAVARRGTISKDNH